MVCRLHSPQIYLSWGIIEKQREVDSYLVRIWCSSMVFIRDFIKNKYSPQIMPTLIKSPQLNLSQDVPKVPMKIHDWWSLDMLRVKSFHQWNEHYWCVIHHKTVQLNIDQVVFKVKHMKRNVKALNQISDTDNETHLWTILYLCIKLK